MSVFNKIPNDALFLSMDDVDSPLSCWSRHPFVLDELEWPSVEHYLNGMKFEDTALRQEIAAATHPREARKIARNHFWKVRKDWQKIQNVVMTRGVYTKCKTHQDARDALLATDSRMIIESSLYDHYWGCGRDQRGHNYYGKILMDVRERLQYESYEKN